MPGAGSRAVTIDRASLEFESAVQESFAWTAELGYRAVTSGLTEVLFDGPHGRLWVTHGESSAELRAGVQRRPGTDWFQAANILGLQDPQAAEEYRNPMTCTRDGVRRFVRELSDLVRRYGWRLLEGDSDEWDRLAEYSARQTREYWHRMNLDAAKRRATAAFRERDLATVVEALSPFRVDLSPAERLKLEYSMKHLEAGSKRG